MSEFEGIFGVLIGVAASWLFYRFGKRDSEMLNRDAVISNVLLRLKEMTPTSKPRVPHGYGLDDTAHWITCLAEVQQQTGWPAGSKGLMKLAASLRAAPHVQDPTPEQEQDGQRQKELWEEMALLIHHPKRFKRQ